MTDAERFVAAKRTSGYQTVMNEEVTRASWRSVILPLVGVGGILGGFSFVLVAAHMPWLVAVAAAMWLWLVVDSVRSQLAPTSKFLAIVGAAGSAAGGDPYSGVAAMRRYLILRTEDGTERGYAATAMAAAGLAHDDIGVATVRRNRVIAFHQLEP